MLNGYKVVVLGSSGITETHLKALKNIKEYELKYIIGKNFNKAKALATKYNIEALNEVNDNILSECNLAVITNSTKDVRPWQPDGGGAWAPTPSCCPSLTSLVLLPVNNK